MSAFSLGGQNAVGGCDADPVPRQPLRRLTGGREPECGALTVPVERRAGDVGQPLPGQRRRLASGDDCRDDVGGGRCEPQRQMNFSEAAGVWRARTATRTSASVTNR